MTSKAPTLLTDGLGFPEALRWHHGELWFSDMLTREVSSVGADRRRRTRAFVPHMPSGLGWSQDGKLLVASMIDRSLVAADETSREVVADLADLAVGPINDMLVDPQGRAYVGSHGFDAPYYVLTSIDELLATMTSVPLILVTPDGAVRIAAEDLLMPNGMGLADDGKVLIVAESLRDRLTAFDVEPDGTLVNRRVFADLGFLPDGICVDREDAAWVSDVAGGRFVRVSEGGEVRDEIKVTGSAVDCVLGGEDGCTLFGSVTTAGRPGSSVWSDGQVRGRIETWQVPVPCRPSI